MPIVITLIIAIFLILISWTWHNFGNVENKRKALITIILLIISFVITFIVFNISKKDITYEFHGEMEIVRRVLVTVFAILNGIVFMPSVAKTINGIQEKEMDKEVVKKRFIIISIILIVILIVECGYLKDIQQGILNIYAMKK